MAKNLLNKYVWLVETIYKAKRITFEEINEKWLANDLSEGIELALRTFHKWRIAAEEMFGLDIEVNFRQDFREADDDIMLLDDTSGVNNVKMTHGAEDAE